MNSHAADPARILIVEDDGDAAGLLQVQLRQAGHQVIGIAGTAEAALHLAESGRPDLVIMDIMLSGPLDGIETAMRLAQRHDIPVLYLTAHADEELYARARLTAPVAYLHKPYDERELTRAIELALDRHTLLRRLRHSEAHLEEAVAARTAELSAANSRLTAEIERRSRVEDMLRRQEQRYRSLVENLPEPLVVFQDDRVVFANPALATLLGLPASGAALGMTVSDLVHADSRVACEACQQACRAGHPSCAPTQIKLMRADRSSLEAEAITFPCELEERPAILVVLRDLTHRRAMEQMAERFRTALDSSADAFFLVDPQAMRFIDVSASACVSLGYGREQLLRLGPQDILPHMNRRMLRQKFAAVLAGQPGAETFHTLHQRQEGSTFPVEVRLRAFASGGQQLIVAVARDTSQQRRNEAALRETEARFRQLAENIDEAFCIRDLRENRFLYVNPAYERLFGKSVKSLYRHPRSFLACIHPQDRGLVETAFDRQLHHASEESIEYRVVAGNVTRWLWVRTFPVRDADGQVYRSIGLAKDVTDRKAAEQALQAAQQFKQAVLDAVCTQVAVLDATGTIVDVNAAWRRFAEENARMAGQPVVNTGIGSSYLSVCDAATGNSSEGAREVAQGIRAVLAGERASFQYEYPCHAPWQQRWFQLNVTPLAGGAQGVVVSHSDITAPRLLAEELRQSEARTRSILRTAPVGIGVLVERVFREVNETMTRMTGYAAQELVGQPARLLYPTQADFDYVGEEKYRQIHEQGIGTVETRWRRKDGTIIDVSLTSAPIVQGDLSQGVTFTAKDITGEKRTERERLAHENAQRDALVREVHHRIKNNLQGVIGLLRQHTAQHPDTQGIMEEAIAQINTIAVVYGLQGRMPHSDLRLRDLLGEIAAAAASLALLPRPPRLRDSLPVDLRLEAGTAVSIALILNELIHNAIKHGCDANRLIMHLSGDATRATLRIVNAGGPLPAGLDLATGQGCGTGLDLVRTLLPRRGASLGLCQSDALIETELVLSAPVVKPSQPSDDPARLP